MQDSIICQDNKAFTTLSIQTLADDLCAYQLANPGSISMIIVDSLACALKDCKGQENYATNVEPMMAALEELAAAIKCPLILTAHMGKESNGGRHGDVSAVPTH